MRQQQNSTATRLRRQTEEVSEVTRAQIVSQAQTLDAQGQPTQFFYQSTIQAPSAVTKALKARFTALASPLEHPMDAPPTEEEKTPQQERLQWQLETNLVTFSSNVLKVYALPSEQSPQMELRLSTQFNSRILDVIRVPTEPFLIEEAALDCQQEAARRKRKGPESAGNLQPARSNRASSRRRKREIEQMIDTTEGKTEDGSPEIIKNNDAPDYLFIILSNFTVALLTYSRQDCRIEVVSRGNISEKILHDQKEPPYPIFLGQNGKFICLMLYHNILKVIPIVLRDDPSNPHICSLTHATAVRVCHSNVMQVVPLYQEGNSEHPTFGIVYQKTDHVRIPGQVGPPALSIKIELEKQVFDLDRRDLTQLEKNGGKLEFAANSVYKIEPLTFGGFLAFDVDTVAYYRGDNLSSAGAFHEQLKSPHLVSAFCQVDDFDGAKLKTATGSPFVRFLFATEAGELFMLAMHCSALRSVLAGDGLDEADQLLNIEFLAQKLTFCSSLVYLDDSLVFYSSKEGDSYILKICAEHQGNQDQPYVAIEQRFTSLAPIMDLQLARPEDTQGQPAELVIVGGWNHQTNMNLVKQGVGLKSVKSFEGLLPADMVQEFYVAGDKVFLRVYGYDQLIGMSVRQRDDAKGAVIAVEGFDVSRNMAVKPTEQILALTGVQLTMASSVEAMDVDQAEEAKKEMLVEVIVIASDTSVKVLDQGSEPICDKVLASFEPKDGQRITAVTIRRQRVIVALQGGTVKHFRLDIEDQAAVSLVDVATIEMGSEVSALSISDDSNLIELVYVCLYDAPHYSLNVLSLTSTLQLLARIPLASILEMPQTKKYYHHQLVKNGQVFHQFNHSKPGPGMLQDLPSAQAIDREDDRMQVDGCSPDQQRRSPCEMAFKFNCTAGSSVEHLTIKSQQTDQILIGFANGKLLQICLDLNHVRDIAHGGAPFLDFQTFVESRLNVEAQVYDDQTGKGHEDLNLERSGPFWGAQVSYVGTILPKMSRIVTDHSEVVIACCDRPVVFYEANESIEMHYLAYRQIRDIASVTGLRPLLLYADERGVLHLSENDNLRKLQIQRMAFKMQISKTLLVPANDAIVVLLEQPNMDYIDSSKAATNVVALVSRSTMRTQAFARLQKGEIANCAYALGPTTNNKARSKWFLVGTAFLDPEETIPSKGRVLLLSAETMELVQEFTTAGSVQSVLVTDHSKFLILGVNNQIQAYDFATFMPTMRGTTVQKLGKLDFLSQKSSGTFIQSIVKLVSPNAETTPEGLAESIVVGDMTGRGVSTFELKECRQTKVKIVESACSHISLWVNSIVALSESQFIVFDHEGNLFIFQKNLYPTCIEEKLKLTLKASYCIGEEVQSAAFGSLRSDVLQFDDLTSVEARTPHGTKVRQKKRHYVDSVSRKAPAADRVTSKTADGDKKEEEVMIVTRSSVAKLNQNSQKEVWAAELADHQNFGQLLKDIEFAKRFAAKTLEEMFVMQAHKCSIVYGTADGSIGSLFQIPPKVYLLLQLLQHEMDHNINLDLVQQKRSDFRLVKQTPATSTELQASKTVLNGIIDGDLVEAFLDLPKQRKLEFARGMLGISAKPDETFVELLTQIVSLMKKTH